MSDSRQPFYAMPGGPKSTIKFLFSGLPGMGCLLPGRRQGAGYKSTRRDDWGRISHTLQGGTTAGGTVWWIRGVTAAGSDK